MLINQKLVGEVEADAAERVAGARWLPDVDGSILVLSYLQADAIECLRVRLQRRQIFVLDDRGRHIPGRIDGDELHISAHHRRRLARLPGYDLGVPVRLAIVVENPLYDDEVRALTRHEAVLPLPSAQASPVRWREPPFP